MKLARRQSAISGKSEKKTPSGGAAADRGGSSQVRKRGDGDGLHCFCSVILIFGLFSLVASQVASFLPLSSKSRRMGDDDDSSDDSGESSLDEALSTSPTKPSRMSIPAPPPPRPAPQPSSRPPLPSPPPSSVLPQGSPTGGIDTSGSSSLFDASVSTAGLFFLLGLSPIFKADLNVSVRYRHHGRIRPYRSF